jgi:hypothetical protein
MIERLAALFRIQEIPDFVIDSDAEDAVKVSRSFISTSKEMLI